MLASIPKAHSEVVTSLSFSPHFRTTPSHDLLLCSTSGDDTAALWDGRLLISGTAAFSGSTTSGPVTPAGRVMTLAHHRQPVNHALFALHNPHLLLTCSDDGTVAMWDLRRADSVVGTLTGFTQGVNKMMWLPSEMCPRLAGPGCGAEVLDSGTSVPLLASACDDGLVYIHALADGDSTTTAAAAGTVCSVGTLIDKFFASTSTVNDMVLLPRARGLPASSRVLATASEDGAVRTWRLPFDSAVPAEGRLLASFDEFSNPVNHLALVPSRSMWRAQCRLTDNNDDDDDEGGHQSQGDRVPEANEEGAPVGGTHRHGADTVACEEAEEAEEEDSYWLLAACSEHVFGVDLDARTGTFGSGAIHFSGHSDYVRGLEFVPSSRATSTTASAADNNSRTPLLLTVADDGTAVEWTLHDWPRPTTATTGHPTRTDMPAANEEARGPSGTEGSADAAHAAAAARIHVTHMDADDDDDDAQAQGEEEATERDDDDNDDEDAEEMAMENTGGVEMQPGGEATFQAQLQEGLIMASAVAPADRTIFATGSDTGDIKIWRAPLSITNSAA